MAEVAASIEAQAGILELEKIPFMNWGIISRYNFYTFKNVPVKRWDPLSSAAIELHEYGYTIKLLKQFGHYSYISPIRAARVNQFKDIPLDSRAPTEFIDLFKATIDGRDYIDDAGQKIGDAYSITICDGKNKLDSPYSVKPRIRSTREKAITFINKFPAMCRVIEPDIRAYIEKYLDENSKIAMGINLLTTPRSYGEHFEDLEPDVIAALFESMIAGIKYVKEESNKNGIYLIPVSPFFNIGSKVGGSVPRLHGQVYVDLLEDGHGSRMENMLKAFAEMKKHNACHLCRSHHESGARAIVVSDHWVLFSSGSPIRNYHLRLSPREHVECIDDLNAAQILDLSRLLQLTSKALNTLGVEKNRNLIINTKPHGYDSYFHVFLDFIPFETIGGAEMADSMRVVRISPLVVAEDMRNAITRLSRESSDEPQTEG
ncbi:MAG: HIT domain-containing protein [Candidatus Lokiarchaeota archaeon]|nr:HIT domain-containing protein [Candidatus Lokiarchaeota archaeon]